jgi:hypothetical protein
MTWTRQRIAFLATLIFIAHVVGIFALHTPPPMVALPDTFRASRLAPPLISTNNFVELNGLNDPLVFAGAHEHGFSASAWMMRPKQDYAWTNAKPSPRFLTFARTPIDLPAHTPESIALSHTKLPFVEIPLAEEPHKSTLRIEGDLHARSLLKSPEIPIQFAADVLTNTVVQIAVKPDGFPFSARVVTGSGSRATDLRALEIANRLRFAPLTPAVARDSTDLQWGECVFQWFTTAPNATNTIAAPVTAAAK